MTIGAPYISGDTIIPVGGWNGQNTIRKGKLRIVIGACPAKLFMERKSTIEGRCVLYSNFVSFPFLSLSLSRACLFFFWFSSGW